MTKVKQQWEKEKKALKKLEKLINDKEGAIDCKSLSRSIHDSPLQDSNTEVGYYLKQVEEATQKTKQLSSDISKVKEDSEFRTWECVNDQ